MNADELRPEIGFWNRLWITVLFTAAWILYFLLLLFALNFSQAKPGLYVLAFFLSIFSFFPLAGSRYLANLECKPGVIRVLMLKRLKPSVLEFKEIRYQQAKVIAIIGTFFCFRLDQGLPLYTSRIWKNKKARFELAVNEAGHLEFIDL